MKKKLLSLAFALCTFYSYAQEVSSGKISGLAYADYFYNVGRDTGIASIQNKALTGSKDFNGFQFRRIYFTYDYNISEKFNTRFRLEADQEANTSNGKIGVFVKDAYVSWKDIFIGSSLFAGIHPTPAFEVSEFVWGYRSLEKTIMDLRGIVSSRDMGITLKGKIDNGGIFNYSLMFGNGSGNIPEFDKYKRYYALVYIKPVKNVHFSLYGDLRAQPNKKYTSGSSVYSFSNHYITTAFFAGYKRENMLSGGVEAVYYKKQNNLAETITPEALKVIDVDALGISLFGSVAIAAQFTALARWDYFDPNFNSDYKKDARNFFIAGVDYSPEKNISVIPNVLIETYESPEVNRDASITARITLVFAY